MILSQSVTVYVETSRYDYFGSLEQPFAGGHADFRAVLVDEAELTI